MDRRCCSSPQLTGMLDFLGLVVFLVSYGLPRGQEEVALLNNPDRLFCAISKNQRTEFILKITKSLNSSVLSKVLIKCAI